MAWSKMISLWWLQAGHWPASGSTGTPILYLSEITNSAGLIWKQSVGDSRTFNLRMSGKSSSTTNLIQSKRLSHNLYQLPSTLQAHPLFVCLFVCLNNQFWIGWRELNWLEGASKGYISSPPNSHPPPITRHLILNGQLERARTFWSILKEFASFSY